MRAEPKSSKITVKKCAIGKALCSELLTELSSWFLSRNEFFVIFEVQV